MQSKKRVTVHPGVENPGFSARRTCHLPKNTRIQNDYSCAAPKKPVFWTSPKHSLPLVARYANIWNAVQLNPDEFLEHSALLDKLLLEAGPQPNDVKRTITLALLCGRDPAELEQRVSGLRHIYPPLTDLPPDALLETISTGFMGTIVGTPDQVVKQIRVYDELGVDELMIHWFCLEDIEGLHLLAEHVLPYIE